MLKNKALHPEGLLKLYADTYITLQTFLQERFLLRFVCFIPFIKAVQK